MKLKLYNTFEIAVPIWDYIIQGIEENNFDRLQVKAVVSKGIYRAERKSKIADYHEYVFLPSFLKHSKMASHLFYFLIVPFKILFSSSDTVNIFYTQPPFFYLIAGWFSRLRGLPYIIHVMDLQPDMLGALGKMKKEGFLYRLTSRMGNAALRNAHQVIVIGDCMQDLIRSKGVAAERIVSIPNIASNEKTTSIEKAQNPFLKKHGIQDKFIILYSGNMGYAHQFDTILKVSQELSEHPDILFLFVGKGSRRVEIENFVEENQPENVLLLGFLPLEDLQYSLGGADVHFISLRKGFEGIMVPSKFYGCLASGKAILYEGSAAGEIAKELKRSDSGKAVLPDDVAALKAAILHYYQDQTACKIAGQNGQNRYQSAFSTEHFKKKYTQLIQQLHGHH